MTDPGLRFWLSHVAAEGGLWEPAGDSTLVVLPPALGATYRLPEELVVSDDPDVARSDGVSFLGTGHPVLVEAAEAVLRAGDTGIVALAPPAGPMPSAEVLQAEAREQIPVSHGRIDVVGAPRAATHWVLRVGALVDYTVSTEDQFAEQIERWVHVGSRREVPAAVLDRITRAAPAPGGPADAPPGGELVVALAEADRLIEVDALRRRTVLGGHGGGAHDLERDRAQTYYADAVAGLERRLGAATPDRRELLAARLVATRAERARRLAEIAEKHQPRHEVKPFRLHLVGVPALLVPVDVRRGERRYPIELDWLRPAGVFAQPRCPSCDRIAPLVSGKSGLGCTVCLAPKTQPTPRPRAGADPAPRPPLAVVPDVPVRATPAAKAVPAGAAGTTPRGVVSRAQPRRRGSTAPERADKVAIALWTAVAAGEGRRLRDILAPDSPAAALRTAYGTEAFPLAIGLPLRESPVECTASSAQVADGRGVTTGTVTTTRSDYTYVLTWREEAAGLTVTEVLRFRPDPDGRFSPYYWWFGGRNALRITALPRPVAHGDPVARRILADGGPWHGLAVAARALAAWGRLGEVQAELAVAHQPAALAAAVHRLVARTAGDSGRFQETSAAYRADEAAVRAADARLRKLLALGPDRHW